MHSNFRELLAVLKMILSFRDYVTGKHLQVLLDNIVTVAYINWLVGSSQLLSNLMTTIWSTAEKYNIHLSSRHLAG